MVAHAALHLIANTLERKGQHTLAHFIENHTTSHPESADKNHTFSLQLLFDKDRLALLDRGIVNANPLS
ncbi:hypothetical protein H6768_00575 [Candidatus Peribacteria bacterium]|nr:hypothetical protein [Candidatus Peribacteria bacterium]